MKEYRGKIIDFFNNKWLDKLKSLKKINTTDSIYTLEIEYFRAYGIRMSRAQLVGLLIENELERVKGLDNFDESFKRINMSNSKLKVSEGLAVIESEVDDYLNDPTFGDYEGDDPDLFDGPEDYNNE